ncbi:MAG: hypothetical protein C4336_06355 [Armatimonadota bacterium]
MMRVQEFVNTHAPTLRWDSTLQDAVDKLDLYQVTLLPILDESDAVQGIITERTVFRIFYPDNPSQPQSSAYALAQTPITQWMQPNPPVLNEHAPITEAVERMQQTGLDTLPVHGDGKFIGTIRLIDCCQALIEESAP